MTLHKWINAVGLLVLAYLLGFLSAQLIEGNSSRSHREVVTTLAAPGAVLRLEPRDEAHRNGPGAAGPTSL